MVLSRSKILNFTTECHWKEKLIYINIAIPSPKYNNHNTEDLTFSPSFTVSGAFNVRWKLGSYTLLYLVIIHPFGKVRASDQVHSIISWFSSGHFYTSTNVTWVSLYVIWHFLTISFHHVFVQCGQKAHLAADSWLTYIPINDTPTRAARLQVTTGSTRCYLECSSTVSCGSYQKPVVFRFKLIGPVLKGKKKNKNMQKSHEKQIDFFNNKHRDVSGHTKLTEITFAEWQKFWNNNHPLWRKVIMSQFGLLSLNVALGEKHKGNS